MEKGPGWPILKGHFIKLKRLAELMTLQMRG